MNQCQYVAMMTTSKLFFSLLAAVIFSAVVSFQPAPSLSLTSWPRFLSSRQRQLLLQPKPTILFIGTGLTFDDGDQRKSTELPTLKAQTGLLAGLAFGQQYNAAGEELKDRQGNPLSFTLESPIMVSGSLLEVSGVRVFKYIPDMNAEDVPGNDFPFLRYSDVLLSKAEALMRTGDNSGALTIENDLRTVRGATPLASITEDDMLEERGRELYIEGWRRNDLVRYGKFLEAWDQKPASDPTYLLYPFPSAQIVANPDLIQNPGY